MKHLFKFVILSGVLFVLSAPLAQTQKRYKKRNHKVQLQVNLDIDDSFSLAGPVQVNYARNFGRFEIGGLVGMSIGDLGFADIVSNVPDLGFHAGLLAEVNFIENKRRINWVPAFGVKLIYFQESSPSFYANPYLVSKHFISTRTSINIELEYPLFLFEGSGFVLIDEGYFQGIHLNVSYAYYFH